MKLVKRRTRVLERSPPSLEPEPSHEPSEGPCKVWVLFSSLMQSSSLFLSSNMVVGLLDYAGHPRKKTGGGRRHKFHNTMGGLGRCEVGMWRCVGQQWRGGQVEERGEGGGARKGHAILAMLSKISFSKLVAYNPRLPL